MNAVSAFGNVRSGALNRVDKRNKTSEKLSGAKKENFDTKTKEFQNQINEYDQSRADKKMQKVEILKLMLQVLVNQDLVEIQAKVVVIQVVEVEELYAQIYTKQENYLL